MMRKLLFLLLACAACIGAAQDNVLVDRLPASVSPESAMQLARAALLGRSWKVLAGDAASITAQNGNSQVRFYVASGALRYADEREPVPPRLITALRADLAAALGQDMTAAPQSRLAPLAALGGSQLLTKPADIDAETMMRAVRIGLEKRKFTILPSGQSGVVAAQFANRRLSSTWKLYLDGDRLMLSDTTMRLSRRGDETEPAETPAGWLNNVRNDIESSIAQAKAAPADGLPQRRVASEPPPHAAASPAERLRTLKELLDAGAVTRDEYDKKRAEILREL